MNLNNKKYKSKKRHNLLILLFNQSVIKLAKSSSKELFDIHRSLNSSNNIKTLKYIKKYITNLNIKFFKFKNVFDWKIPNRWEVKEAFIENLKGKKIVDIKENKLHILQYSIRINKILKYSVLFIF